MICSKHVDVKRHSVCFPEIEKYLPVFFGFEFIRFSNRGVLSAASCILDRQGGVLVRSSGMATVLQNVSCHTTNNAPMLNVHFYIQFVVTPTCLVYLDHLQGGTEHP